MRRDRLGRPVRRDDDLAAAGVEVVEGVEELLLELLGALEELDVVDEQDVDVAVPLLEVRHLLGAHGVDELVHHRLGRNVSDALRREEVPNVVTDRVEQVGLSEACRAVDEERVVETRRALGDGQGRCVGEAVRGPDDELVERVPGDERRPVVGESLVDDACGVGRGGR